VEQGAARVRGLGMKVRILSIFTAGVMVLGVASLMAPAASAGRSPQIARHSMAKAAPQSIGDIIYDQNDNDAGSSIPSQNFETEFDAYDASGADDFTLTATHTKVTHVIVTGVYFNGPGPAVSETVTFYADAGGLPGPRIARRTRTGTDSGGSFVIRLGKRGPLLHAGTYWLGVVVNMDFRVGGQWGWETRAVQSGNPAAWRDRGDGFGVGCKRWRVLTRCFQIGEGPDFMFKLTGY
jgi:hypothetical protein